MNYVTYFEYGFDPNRLYEPTALDQIQPYLAKPKGALWASRANDMGYTWYKWTIENEFYDTDIEKMDHIIFSLKKGTRKFRLHTKEDFQRMCAKYAIEYKEFGYARELILDFKKMARDYDVIDYKVFDLYWEMYGWDCDCICVLNKDVVEVKEVVKS